MRAGVRKSSEQVEAEKIVKEARLEIGKLADASLGGGSRIVESVQKMLNNAKKIYPTIGVTANKLIGEAYMKFGLRAMDDAVMTESLAEKVGVDATVEYATKMLETAVKYWGAYKKEIYSALTELYSDAADVYSGRRDYDPRAKPALTIQKADVHIKDLQELEKVIKKFE